jgi:hypothetical protein
MKAVKPTLPVQKRVPKKDCKACLNKRCTGRCKV